MYRWAHHASRGPLDPSPGWWFTALVHGEAPRGRCAGRGAAPARRFAHQTMWACLVSDTPANRPLVLTSGHGVDTIWARPVTLDSLVLERLALHADDITVYSATVGENFGGEVMQVPALGARETA